MNVHFDKSRKRLSQALKNLEDVVKEKIREAGLNAEILGVNSNEFCDKTHAQFIEQTSVLNSLGNEVNHLQKELSEIGKETEFLRETNKALSEKIKNFRQQKNDLTQAIEDDLAVIHEIIEKYDG
jgi:DNA repair exonuclease SbcCD ATPase subunit